MTSLVTTPRMRGNAYNTTLGKSAGDPRKAATRLQIALRSGLPPDYPASKGREKPEII